MACAGGPGGYQDWDPQVTLIVSLFLGGPSFPVHTPLQATALEPPGIRRWGGGE